MFSRMKNVCCAVAIFAGLCAPLVAGDSPKPKAPPRCAQMDYGPFLTASWGLPNNTTLKGVAVTLDKTKPAYLVFDTELLRVSAAWTGDYTDWQGLVFIHNWGKARGPNITGSVEFQTKPGPGWAGSDGSLADPRANGDGPLPAAWGKYKGLYLHGDKVIFSYTVNGVNVLESPSLAEGQTNAFVRTLTVSASDKPLTMVVKDGAGSVTVSDAAVKLNVVGERTTAVIPARAQAVTFSLAVSKTNSEFTPKTPEPLTALTKGGPARWTSAIETKGARAKDDAAYVVDTVALPEDNPWKSWMRVSALDFFSDGRAAVSTWSGDVWIVSGLDDGLEKVSWKRFATGLFQPLGLRIVNDQIYVLAHGPVLRLHDLNNDGEADFYESFNNDCVVTNNYHEFATDLQTDKDGSFYFLKGAPALAGRKDFERFTAHHGSLLKLSKDGSKLEVVANGFREPNGLGIAPDGTITVTDNQGNWTPECPINVIKSGGFYGMVDPALKTAPPAREGALAWLPMSADNSSGSQVWVSSGKWGPLEGRMLHTSYGKCSLNLVLADPPQLPGQLAGAVQAATIKFPLVFASGIMRGRFHPKDGQLYVCGLKGWGTAANKDGALQRVRFTGKTVGMPIEFSITKTGARVVFSDDLDTASAGDVSNWSAEWFNVVRTADYGSPEFAISDPKKKAREPLEIKSVKLDGKRAVDVEIPGLKPATNIVVKMKIKATDGTAIQYDVNGTINRVP